MSEADKKDNNLTISFNLNQTEKIEKSIINTLSLMLHNINLIYQKDKWDNITAERLNLLIENMKKQLDTLKIKIYESDLDIHNEPKIPYKENYETFAKRKK